jgi:hypothetical protein
MTKGVLVATDQKEEWLLPWWWEAYSRFNAFPVTFVDWGMSEKAKEWCRARGTLISARVDSTFFSEASPSPRIQNAIEVFRAFFLSDVRPYWFSKPVVMKDSTYETTLWLDLDCEVLAPLDALFEYASSPAGVGIARDTEVSEARNIEIGILNEGETLYNSGVVVFRKDSPLIAEWAEVCLRDHHDFFGDQSVLSYLIRDRKYEIVELPDVYNWHMSRGFHFSAQIVHWVGTWGKTFIKQHGGLRPFLNQAFGEK